MKIFSLVVKHSTIRMALAVTLNKNFNIHPRYVTTAFLPGKLEEEIFMEQPASFVWRIIWLEKVIQGLRQTDV
jgi:hypothetical protein